MIRSTDIYKKLSLFEKWVLVVVFLTNMSQLPYLVSLGITQYLSYPVWFLTFGFCLLTALYRRKVIIHRTITINVIIFIFIILVQAVNYLLFQNNYFRSSMFTYAMFSLAIMLAGYVLGEYLSEDSIKIIAIAFVVSTIIVELNVYYESLRSINAFSQRMFAYASKNSVSLLISTAIIILISYFKPEKVLQRAIYFVFIIASLFILLMLKSRASILGLIVAIFLFMLSKASNKKTKRRLWIAVTVIIVLLLFSGRFYQILVGNVFLANSNISDLNDVSSGRISLFLQYPSLIKGHWFEGIGPYYYECAPLSALLQFGLICGLAYIFLMFHPLIYFGRMKTQTESFHMIFLIAVIYSINTLFEGLAPFGPGAKCFFLWFLWGIILRQS